MKISDQIVLVTGSSRGLGAAIARAFYREGAKVILNFVNEKSQKAIQDLIRDLPGALAIQADISNEAEVTELFENVKKYYGESITTVINNALPAFSFNGDARSRLDSIKWTEFESQLRAPHGIINTTQAALPSFRELKQGIIINIGTNLFHNPVVPYHDYTAAKAMILSLTRTMAAELGPLGVRVNCVSGGLLKMTEASNSTPEEVWKQIEGTTPLRKVTTTEEVADVCLFLASEWARGVQGQEIVVDGGLVMK